MSSSLPIGIFDSGIGGLTVANAIRKILPNEQLIYFGDTAHMPYGDKSPEAIKFYSLKIAKFLLDKNCKMIVIACNTASSHAFHELIHFLGDRIPIINVIDPVVDLMVKSGDDKKIGVIGTKSTIRSDIYARKFKQADPGIEVSSLATPLLAPMIEEGFFDNNISKTVINSYLSSSKLKKIDSLILACTHYPLIKSEISSFYKGKVNIINTAEIVAQHVKDRLSDLQLLNAEPAKKHQFFVSDYTPSFAKSTRLFFGEKINLKLEPIWD
ncbi:glutamate racemase [Daejeonella lutea]|uniref:Glutamate racemase n=1 Tax=Daejeonella lutea TaxID=572036 RepID=A0A1T5A0X5_9SPHI|nr:glutamate racemase [Daejeonella lutea]SKB28608.1 glutamate racemase [Daejeonella lutea]